FTRPNLIWVGTNDGLIHVTHDGGRKWTNVTPTALTPWSKVSLMEASHVDTLAVYAAVNRFRLDDLHPHIFRTKDGGRTWTDVVEGIPSKEAVNLYRPAPAVRVRWNENTDTPLPPDEPAAKNPPDGAIVDYYLARPAAAPVTLEILDRAGRLVRRFSSASLSSSSSPSPERPE